MQQLGDDMQTEAWVLSCTEERRQHSLDQFSIRSIGDQVEYDAMQRIEHIGMIGSLDGGTVRGKSFAHYDQQATTLILDESQRRVEIQHHSFELGQQFMVDKDTSKWQ